jgi:hypothetical protein
LAGEDGRQDDTGEQCPVHLRELRGAERGGPHRFGGVDGQADLSAAVFDQVGEVDDVRGG